MQNVLWWCCMSNTGNQPSEPPFPGWMEIMQLHLIATPLPESGDSTEGYSLRI